MDISNAAGTETWIEEGLLSRAFSSANSANIYESNSFKKSFHSDSIPGSWSAPGAELTTLPLDIIALSVREQD